MKKKTRRESRLILSKESIRTLTDVKGGRRNECASCGNSCDSKVGGSCSPTE